MEPVKHPSATRRFGQPSDWDEASQGPCAAIDIADVIEPGSGCRVMESLWRPNAEELAALSAGAAIILGIFGTVHPVIYVGTTVPPQHDPTANAEADREGRDGQ